MAPEPRGKAGNHARRIRDHQAWAMRERGALFQDIAARLGCSVETARRAAFHGYLRTKKARLTAATAGVTYETAPIADAPERARVSQPNIAHLPDAGRAAFGADWQALRHIYTAYRLAYIRRPGCPV